MYISVCTMYTIHEYNWCVVYRQMRLIPHLLPGRVTLTQLLWWSQAYTQDNKNEDNGNEDNDNEDNSEDRQDSQDNDNDPHLLLARVTLTQLMWWSKATTKTTTTKQLQRKQGQWRQRQRRQQQRRQPRQPRQPRRWQWPSSIAG